MPNETKTSPLDDLFHPEIARMSRMYRFRLEAELRSMLDPRFRHRYQGRAKKIKDGVRSLAEFQDLSDSAIVAAAGAMGLL